jgi:uncharacterized protein (TIGR00725 family)
MRRMIGISGSDSGDSSLTPSTLKIAEELGCYVAKKGAVLVSGGRGGVMEAAARGAKNAQGLTVGIMPESAGEANSFIDIAIPTYMGYARNYLLVRSVDALIAIAGRWGTLNEISLALSIGKPTIIIKGTGGWADILAEEGLLERFEVRPRVASSAREAVELAIKMIQRYHVPDSRAEVS